MSQHPEGKRGARIVWFWAGNPAAAVAVDAQITTRYNSRD